MEIGLDLLTADEFEAEARDAGFARLERLDVPETDDHIGSAVIVCRL